MTKQEFLDKEHEFGQGKDTDVVKFYHNIIMKIFDEQSDEISKALEIGRDGLLKVCTERLDDKAKQLDEAAHAYLLEFKEDFIEKYEKEHEFKVTFEGAESEEGEQVFTLPDQLNELIANVHDYAVHNCDFKVNGRYYGSI